MNDRTMPKVLLTGFEPFAGERINPSGEIVYALDRAIANGHEIVGAVLPVARRSLPRAVVQNAAAAG